MASGGRRATKPTAIKIAEGDRGRRKPSMDDDPPFTAAPPKPPKVLLKEARAEWRRVVPELEKAGLLATVDRAALANYCQLWARWVEVEEKIKGYVIKGKKGDAVINPYMRLSLELSKRLCSTLREFGLSPASRSGLGVTNPHGQEKDLWKRLGEMQRRAKERQAK